MIFGPKYSQATEMESESKNQTNLTQTMHSCLLCKSLETQQKQLSTLKPYNLYIRPEQNAVALLNIKKKTIFVIIFLYGIYEQL